MDAARTEIPRDSDEYRRRIQSFCREIQQIGARGLSRLDFLAAASELAFELKLAETIEIRLSDDQLAYRWLRHFGRTGEDEYEVRRTGGGPVRRRGQSCAENAVESPAIATDVGVYPESLNANPGVEVAVEAGSGTRITVPLNVSDSASGVIVLRLNADRPFDEMLRDDLELLGQFMASAIVNRRAQFRLRERIKELTCLFGVSREVQSVERPVPNTLARIARLLPPAWQYPEIAGATVRVRTMAGEAGDRSKAVHVQSSPIWLNGAESGVVEVFYCEDRPDFIEGAFLPEERSLLDNVAREVAQYVERVEASHEKRRLEQRLLHADRLATIGQLAAGVAHEINEPLANILGFAQLIQKEKGLANQVWRDLQQIVDAALHGREVIKNLLLFARQAPPAMKRVDLNRIIRESGAMVAKRCAEKGVNLALQFRESTQLLSADPSQMKQMVINLMVNAIDAMPTGGTVSLETHASDGWVEFSVTDTGIGIPNDAIKRVFEPFFTTKDVNEGTGLGLSVVHGIVTSHGGEIRVESRLGRGTKFMIRLPIVEHQPTEQ